MRLIFIQPNVFDCLDVEPTLYSGADRKRSDNHTECVESL